MHLRKPRGFVYQPQDLKDELEQEQQANASYYSCPRRSTASFFAFRGFRINRKLLRSEEKDVWGGAPLKMFHLSREAAREPQ